MALALWGMDPFGSMVDPFLGFGGTLGTRDFPRLPQDLMFRSVGGTHPMDVIEYKDRYEIVADAPDFSPEDINVEIQNGVLVVRGEKQIQREEKGEQGKVWRSERMVRKFTRSFVLPKDAKEEGIQALLDKGVLKVVIPKAPEPEKPEPKRIDVKPSSETAAAGTSTGTGTGAGREHHKVTGGTA